MAALAWVAARRLRSRGGAPGGPEASGGSTSDAPDEARQIAIESSGETGQGSPGGEDRASSGGDGGESISDEPISEEDIEGHATEDPHQEPAEPGELNVDEEVLEEVDDDEGDVEPNTGENESGP